VLHGNKTYLLQDEDGQITEAHSISAGLDYPGIGPEHAWLKETGRVEYTAVTDTEALDAFQLLCRTEGIIPALEPSTPSRRWRRSRRRCRRTRSSSPTCAGAATRTSSPWRSAGGGDVTIRINWNWAGWLLAFCISLPLYLLVLWVEWPSDMFFIAALIAAGVISLALSWAIAPRLQRKWKKRKPASNSIP
jgi:hypothetical protein